MKIEIVGHATWLDEGNGKERGVTGGDVLSVIRKSCHAAPRPLRVGESRRGREKKKKKGRRASLRTFAVPLEVVVTREEPEVRVKG